MPDPFNEASTMPNDRDKARLHRRRYRNLELDVLR